MMFYKKFTVKCDCKEAKDLTWDSINNFYFCDTCNKSFDEDSIEEPK